MFYVAFSEWEMELEEFMQSVQGCFVNVCQHQAPSPGSPPQVSEHGILKLWEPLTCIFKSPGNYLCDLEQVI